ncbi:hypothetical protein D3C81_1179430 [compost metagenome]
MQAGERQRVGAHVGQTRFIGQHGRGGGHQGVGIGHAQAGAGGDGILGGLGKVEGVRAHQHRRADGAGLDQILSTERDQAAADIGDIRGGVVHRHLAHGVAEHDVGRDRGVEGVHIQLAAALHAEAGTRGQRSYLVKPLRMARHQQQRGTRRAGPAREGVQDQGLLPFSRARGGQHVAGAERAAQGMAARDAGFRRLHVELEVAGHLHGLHAERAIALGIASRLGQHRREIVIQRGRRAAEARCPPITARRQPGIDQEQRHAHPARDVDQVGPDLGLHDQPRLGPEVGQEAAHQRRHVVRQVALLHARVVAIELLTGLAAGRRHVGQQNTMTGIRGQQRVEQRLRGARLADGHRMDPEPRPAGRQPAISAKPLPDVAAIAGFLARPPDQAQQRQWEDHPPQQRVNQTKHQAGTPRTRTAAA